MHKVIRDHQKMISEYLAVMGVLAMLAAVVALIAFPIWLSNQPEALKEPFASLAALVISALGVGGIAAYAIELVRGERANWRKTMSNISAVEKLDLSKFDFLQAKVLDTVQATGALVPLQKTTDCSREGNR